MYTLGRGTFFQKRGDMRRQSLKAGKSVYLVKAVLSDLYGRVKGKPFRVLAVPEDYTLYGLAKAIIESFDFGFDHPFGFYDEINRWIDSKEGYELFADMGEESEFKGVKKTKVNSVFNQIGKKMLFLFDYGDEWHFVVELKGIELLKEGERYPFIVDSFGEARPQYSEEE
jgi:hypothetical protein